MKFKIRFVCEIQDWICMTYLTYINNSENYNTNLYLIVVVIR